VTMNERGWLGAVVGLAMAELAACSAVLGYDEIPTSATTSTTASGGGGAGGVPHGGSNTGGQANAAGSGGGGGTECSDFGSECYSCAQSVCRDLYCGCVASQECISLASCVDSCSAPQELACLQSCYANAPAAVSQVALINDCLGDQCAGLCPGATPLSPCLRCLHQSCASAMGECLADTGCANLLYCAESCLEWACLEGCIGVYPEGAVLFDAVHACQTEVCPEDCPWAAA